MIYVPQNITEWLDDDIPDVALQHNPLTTYAVGDIARVGNYQYKSTIDGNKGNDPIETLGIYWIEWQPANDFSMLDLESDFKTKWNSDTGYVKFTRGSKNYIGIGLFNANVITIEYLDTSDNVLDTDIFTFSNNSTVWDEWTYGYGEFQSSVNKVVYTPLKRTGVNIKVTFENTSGQNIEVGFLVAGVAYDGGRTLDNVNFPDKRKGELLIKTATFSTYVRDTALSRKVLIDAKSRANIPMMYVIDDQTNSKFDNMILIGKSTSITAVAGQQELSQVNWTLEQTNYTE